MTGIATKPTSLKADRRRLHDIELAEKRLERGRCPRVFRGAFRLMTSLHDQASRARNIKDVLRSGSRRARCSPGSQGPGHTIGLRQDMTSSFANRLAHKSKVAYLEADAPRTSRATISLQSVFKIPTIPSRPKARQKSVKGVKSDPVNSVLGLGFHNCHRPHRGAGDSVRSSACLGQSH